jgi:3-deoxy-D-manno-octulosonic-acid transferase
VIHQAYTAGLVGLLVLYAPAALIRRLTRGVPVHLRDRLGYGPATAPAAGAGWIHAVSVGEAMAAAPLLEELRRRHPELPLVMTTVTETGARVVRDQFAHLVSHRFFPLDLPGAVERVTRAINPVFLVCMETELWPNLLRRLGARQVPIMIASGRLSDRSFRRYRLVRPFMRSLLEPVSVFAMQSAEDARRMIALGARAERVFVTGNVKGDAVPAAAGAAELWHRLLGFRPGQRVWIAGSTHRGEEEAVLDAHAAAGPRGSIALILAPRHPDRVDEVLGTVTARGWPALRRTRLPVRRGDDAVVVLDTIGELAQVYAVADAVFVGGSLVPIGGHNMLEPARLGKPVLFGPHTENFREPAALLEASGGGVRVQNVAELAAALRALLADASLRARVGAAARRAAESGQGATRQTLDLIDRFLLDGRGA